MIISVDDDSSVLEMIKTILESEGYSIETFESVNLCLKVLAEREPELIISDVMMPEMGGFEFKSAYNKKYPGRSTPFVFLSSLSDTDSIVKGLESGVDDYLVKPFVPELLKAKVRSILARKTRYSMSIFYGDIEKMPFANIIKFCELNGMTGEVEFRSETESTTLIFHAGTLIINETDDNFDETLNKLFDLTKGNFVISSQSVDYKEIETSSLDIKENVYKQPSFTQKASGQLSGVKVRDRLFQVQTEHVNYPENCIVTIVVLDGKTVLKSSSPPLETDNLEEIGKIIRLKHADAEREIKEKLNSFFQKVPAEEGQSTQENFNRLFEKGFDKYREKDYVEALAIWEEAKKINPGNNTLDINMKIVKNKLNKV